MKNYPGLLVLLVGALGTLSLVASDSPGDRQAGQVVPSSLGSAGAGQPTRDDLTALAKRAEQELRGNILPFWLKNTRNRERGGFYGVIDEKMRPHPDAS